MHRASDPSIQTLRQAHDMVFERWPPHFNIDCFPFYPAETHEEWAPKIQRVCADLEPLALALNSVAHFPASKRKPGTLYAGHGGGRRQQRTAAALKFPRQGGTNITAGVKMAVDVCMAEGDPSVHYMITFLSDGAHNTGPRLSDADIATMRAAVDACGMSLSINVVGLCSPDTSLGMRVKTGLETVSLEAMESVYYARSQGELQGVLGQLTEGCVGSVSKGAPVTAAVEGGVFAESKAETATVHV